MSKVSVGGNATFNGINFKSRTVDVRVRRKKGKTLVNTNYTFPMKGVKKNKENLLAKINSFLSYTPFFRGPWLLVTSFKKNWKMMIALYFTFMLLLIGVVYSSPSAQEFLSNEELAREADIIIAGAFVLFVIIFFYFSPVARYHGAEHKAINTIRDGEYPTIENLKKASRVSRNCGTVYLTIFLVIFLILSPFLNVLLAFLIALSVGFELFLAEQKWLAKILSPIIHLALLIQKYITTREPKEKHLKVAQSGIWIVKKAVLLDEALEHIKNGRFQNGDIVIDQMLKADESNDIIKFYKANSLYYQKKYQEALEYISENKLTQSRISPKLVDILIEEIISKNRVV